MFDFPLAGFSFKNFKFTVEINDFFIISNKGHRGLIHGFIETWGINRFYIY